MSGARWDLVMEVVRGASTVDGGEQILRGPRVVVGSAPGPGGFRLTGTRGVAARHAELTAKGPREAFITPVGSHPVRFSPSDDVHWDDLEPVGRQVRLSRGSLVHLGPTGGGRGVTLRFLACRDLGSRATDRLTSERHDEGLGDVAPAVRAMQATAAPVVGSGERAPDGGIPARVRRLAVTRLAEQRMSTPMMLASVLAAASALMLVAAAVIFTVQRGASEDDFVVREQVYEALWVDAPPPPPPQFLRGFEQAFAEIVVEPNRLAYEAVHGMGASRGVLALQTDTSEGWDKVLFEAVAAQAAVMARDRKVLAVLDRAADDYAYVVGSLRAAGLPEAIAAVPYVESRYRASARSQLCAIGWWQYMPEWGPYLSQGKGLGDDYRVARCPRRGSSAMFTPTAFAPPHNVKKNAPYVDNQDSCGLSRCQIDFRYDLVRSTTAAVLSFDAAVSDPDIGGSGAATQIALMAHYAGYDDAGKTGGKPKAYNLDVAYKRWVRDGQQDPSGEAVHTSHFWGATARCPSSTSVVEGCQKYLFQQTQRYAVMSLAVHAVAVCHYAKKHGAKPQFERWKDNLDGYCATLAVGAK